MAAEDLNSGSFDFESEALTTEPLRSVVNSSVVS